MSSKQDTVDYLAGQMGQAGAIRTRKMFGDYAVYCNEKVVALVCEDQLYVKITEAGRKYLPYTVEVPPYRGAKNYFQISEDDWENKEWMGELIRITAAELPAMKKK